jgi:hypothetical protein
VTASQAQAEQAKAQAKQNANAYQGLLDQYMGRKSSDQSAADAIDQQNAAKTGQANAQAQATNADNSQMTSDPKTWNAAQWVRNIGGYLSPVDDFAHAAGQKGPIDYSTDYFENQYGPLGGDKSMAETELKKRNRP